MTIQKTLEIPRLLSIAQVALHLGVSQKTVFRLIKELPNHRVRGQVRISEADLTAYLARVRFIWH